MKEYSFTTQEISDAITAAGVKPSAQRIAIMRFLMENRIHPTVDEIHKSLQPEIPTLSRTTVYNTLRLLGDAGLIKCIETGLGDGSHWDYLHHDHSHLVCTCCGRIEDIDFLLPTSSFPVAGNGCEIDSVDVIFRGRCRACSSGMQA